MNNRPGLLDFVGKVALVTAAGGGIGRAAAELLATQDAAVVDINADIGRETVARIEGASSKAISSKPS